MATASFFMSVRPQTFDRRVVAEPVLTLLASLRTAAPFHLGGGAALSGVHLGHRLSDDVDLFVHSAEATRDLVRALPVIAAALGGSASIVRDGGMHVRAELTVGGRLLRADIVHEPQVDLAPAEEVEGVAVESFDDLRASKITCLLSRTEPRDLVDVLFLERSGHPPEQDLGLALRKDAGIDPAVLAWLLSRFRVEPLPQMLVPFEARELLAYRDALAERFRALATTGG